MHRTLLLTLPCLVLASLAPLSALAGAPPKPSERGHGRPERAEEPSSNHAPLIALAAVAGLVVIGGGVFAMSRGRKGAPAGAAAGSGGKGPSAWQQQLRRAKKQSGWDWEYESEPARAVVTQLLTDAAPGFGPGHVRLMPDDSDIELRGTYGGAPICFTVSMSFGSLGTEMRCERRIEGELDLTRDLSKIPTTHNAQDPFDRGATQRIFLAKGIFMEGSSDLDEKLATWGKLPPALQASVLQAMDGMDVRSLWGGADKLLLRATPRLDDLDDPIAHMQACAKLLLDIRNALPLTDGDPGQPMIRIRGNVVINGVPIQATSAPPAGGANAASPAVRLVCKFCSSIFLMSVGKAACPNCGAHATA